MLRVIGGSSIGVENISRFTEEEIEKYNNRNLYVCNVLFISVYMYHIEEKLMMPCIHVYVCKKEHFVI